MATDLPFLQSLSCHEVDDFGCVLDAARNMGWIDINDAPFASRAASRIIVRLVRSGYLLQCSYADTDRWIYEFLRDLAGGMWRRRLARATP